jgi:hypothetical protein
MKISFRKITAQYEKFLADDSLSYFIEKAEYFMIKNLSEEMEEEEAIAHLEKEFLFNEEKNKADIINAADVLRAIRMIQYYRKKEVS